MSKDAEEMTDIIFQKPINKNFGIPYWCGEKEMIDRGALQDYLATTYPNLKLTVSPTLTEDGHAKACHWLSCYAHISKIDAKHIHEQLIEMLEDEKQLIEKSLWELEHESDSSNQTE